MADLVVMLSRPILGASVVGVRETIPRPSVFFLGAAGGDEQAIDDLLSSGEDVLTFHAHGRKHITNVNKKKKK
jgi:hypothetical protein